MTDFEKLGENDLPDFDNLFCDFVPDDLYFFDGDSSSDSKIPNSDPSSHPSDKPASLAIGEIENFLLNDDFDPLTANDADAFLSDLLVDSSPTVDAGSDSSASVPPSPATAKDCSPSDSDAATARDCSPSDSDGKGHHLHKQEEEKKHVGNHDDDAVDDEDPAAKKRKRQLRNRDAAVRSRERKKLYVRDLEMKSKYYEAECRRLQWMLQCVRAENHALQFALHSNHQAFGTSNTKQESAVLLLESLLLGSLLWLMGIIGLFILLPGQLLSVLEAALLEDGGEENQRSLAARRKVESDILGMSVFWSFMKSKGWRGSRTRMKVFFNRLCKWLMSIHLSFYEPQAKSFSAW